MGGSTQGGSVAVVSSAPLFAVTGASVIGSGTGALVIGSGRAESVKALSSSPAAAAAVTEASRLGFGLAARGDIRGWGATKGPTRKGGSTGLDCWYSDALVGVYWVMVGIGRRVSPGLDIQDYGMAVRSMKAQWDVGWEVGLVGGGCVGGTMKIFL